MLLSGRVPLLLFAALPVSARSPTVIPESNFVYFQSNLLHWEICRFCNTIRICLKISLVSLRLSANKYLHSFFIFVVMFYPLAAAFVLIHVRGVVLITMQLFHYSVDSSRTSLPPFRFPEIVVPLARESDQTFSQ